MKGFYVVYLWLYVIVKPRNISKGGLDDRVIPVPDGGFYNVLRQNGL